MDIELARQRLEHEHVSLHELLLSSAVHRVDEQAGARDALGASDTEESLTSQEEEDAVAAALRVRLIQVHGAIDRLAAGTYGHSLRSGDLISPERLDADPAAELTADEAAD